MKSVEEEVGVIFTVYGMSFRVLNNGTVQSRSDKYKWEWAERSPKETNITDSTMHMIRYFLQQLSSALPNDQVILPSSEGLKKPLWRSTDPAGGNVVGVFEGPGPTSQGGVQK